MNKIKLMSTVVIIVDKIAEELLISNLKYDLAQSQFDEDEKEIAEYAITDLTIKVISKNMLVIIFDSIFSESDLKIILKDYDKKACFVFDKE